MKKCTNLLESKELRKEWLMSEYLAILYSISTECILYDGLPESIPPDIFSLYIQSGGYVIIPAKGVLKEQYVFLGGLGGERDVYYRPMKAIVNNPGLNLNAEWRIGQECAVIPFTTTYIGVDLLNQTTSRKLAEATITHELNIIQSRAPYIIAADNDNSAQAATKYLKNVENGDLGVIQSNDLFESIHISPTAAPMLMTNEIRQIWAAWYNDLGYDAQWNMKKERMTEAEATHTSQPITIIDTAINVQNEYFKRYEDILGFSCTARRNEGVVKWMND